ncbi:glyoxylate/hydroxypyruvate reductase A [Mesorhizobium sp. M0047]|uniref:2-hydroxyacid dehydrogenase n=1 Tax=Mesorhizobium sp. M0047 TaxID=2956859 RepID=UPI00333ABC0A
MGKVLLSVGDIEADDWLRGLSLEHDVVMNVDQQSAQEIKYAVVWKPEHGTLAKLPNLEVIFSVGAGVDHILSDPQLPDVPIVKVVSENLTQHVTEYVVWRVLDHHRQGALYREQQRAGLWSEKPQRPAQEVSVGIMGLGQLGRSAGLALKHLGFRINGWSRTSQQVDGITSYHGDADLTPFLNDTDILVILLPLTPETEGIINYELLSRLRRLPAYPGPVLINAGRGKLQREPDILKALTDGTIQQATLDVFEEEPLPARSPLWGLPNLVVTPHAAGMSDPNHLVPAMLRQMAAYERSGDLGPVIDRTLGY